MNRQSAQERITKESTIKVSLNLDGSGIAKINTGIGFFEDVGIVLGKAFKQAIGDKLGIRRIGYSYVPMDEALALVVVDFSNRPYSFIKIPWTGKYFGKNQDELIPLTLIEHFLQTFAINAGITLHVKVFYGKNDHHMAEAVFKALGSSLDKASRLDPKRRGSIPSTKGIL